MFSVAGALRSSTRRILFPRPRANSTIAGVVYYRCSYHDSQKLALICPHEDVRWTYAELWGQVQKVAGGLKGMGYGEGAVIATDMKNSVANLLLQLAVAHNSMSVMTVKSKEEFDTLKGQVPLDGVVMASSSSFLGNAAGKSIDAAGLRKLSGKAGEGATDRDYRLAYYSSPTETTNREVYLYGIGTAGTLLIGSDDQVCVACSLNHPFGMGAAVSALLRSATIYLPDMDKLDLNESTLLVTDKHQLEKLRAAAGAGSKLRGGLVKTGSGYDLLLEKTEVGGAELWTLGTAPKPKVFRPLFDACVDKYYSYK